MKTVKSPMSYIYIYIYVILYYMQVMLSVYVQGEIKVLLLLLLLSSQSLFLQLFDMRSLIIYLIYIAGHFFMIGLVKP